MAGFRAVVVASIAGACLFQAGPARADSGLFLTWRDCALSPNAVANLTSPCATDIGTRALYAAFTVAQPVDSVIALEISVDIQHASASLAPWWHFEPLGCRDGSLAADADFSGDAACVDFWAGRASANPPFTYVVGLPRGGANQARIVVAVAMAPTTTVRLDAGPMYYAVKLFIDDAHTSTCSGCLEGACLVLNSILLGRHPGAAGGNVTIDTPGPGDANWATWQGGAGADCNAVPVRRTTWGRLKGLYR